MLSPSRSSATAGAIITLATSNDDRHPPECIIDGNPDTYWMSTGIYPQEVIITLPSATQLTSVLIRTANVRKVRLESTAGSTAADFEKIVEKDLDSQDGQVQSEEFKLENPATVRHLKLVLVQGFEHFATVYSVTITPLH